MTLSSRHSRRFLIAVSVLCFLALASQLRAWIGSAEFLSKDNNLSRRSLISGADEGFETCREVHQARDQCAFVKAHCGDEDAGLLSYLDLYYCRLAQAKPLGFIIIATWTALLFTTIGVAASDFFCINLSTIATILGLSESMAGVTFLAFGNGSPDVFSTFAAIKSNSGSLAVGELIGAAGFITAVISGSMALVRPFKVARRSFVRDVGFFIVAVGFSMSFLANGKLELWECAVMVGFYIFYVLIVVVWHWWLGRQKRRREQVAAIRGHFINDNDEDIEYEENYRDDEDEANSGRRDSLMQNVSTESFHDLERADLTIDDEAEDDLEEEVERDKWLGELSSNMRVKKPTTRDRSRTVYNPIRPSLLGALEFRAVLSSLQKSRNIKSIPISNLRRYSDDTYFTTLQQQEGLSDHPELMTRSSTDGLQVNNQRGTHLSRPELASTAGGNRTRAVSANAADFLRVDTSVPLGTTPAIFESPVMDSAMEAASDERSGFDTGHLRPGDGPPLLSVSPPPENTDESDTQTSLDGASRGLSGFLSPSGAAVSSGNAEEPLDTSSSSNNRPRLRLTPPNSHRSSRRSSVSPSPNRIGSDARLSLGGQARPGHLRGPSASIDSYLSLTEIPQEEKRPPRWWPQNKLPSPDQIIHTLFPTVYNWRQKSIWDKFLGLASAPSFFFLTITLPVVEPESTEISIIPGKTAEQYPITSEGLAGQHEQIQSNGNAAGSFYSLNDPLHHSTANVAVHVEQSHHHSHSAHSPLPYRDDPPQGPLQLVPSASSTVDAAPQHPHAAVSSSKEWNRWLIIVQCFTAPIFVTFMLWANLTDHSFKALLYPILYSLLGSLAALLLILTTTTSSRPPRWHFLLCFAGFAVSITWISSIANEVVGVLKAIGIIFDISDAILGLTIFAVGNSLGDLVADITVARLGYPVMALSACFGGPMLNILLGIGLSGLYMIIHKADARHEKHPDKKLKVKPYKVDVSPTLMISAVALLVTLVGLLIVVPWNKWVMDRRIGWGLIALWLVATIGNLVVEVTGVLD